MPGLTTAPRARWLPGCRAAAADYNHCDLTTMLGAVADNRNDGRVHGIAHHNPLGHGITVGLPAVLRHAGLLVAARERRGAFPAVCLRAFIAVYRGAFLADYRRAAVERGRARERERGPGLALHSGSVVLPGGCWVTPSHPVPACLAGNAFLARRWPRTPLLAPAGAGAPACRAATRSRLPTSPTCSSAPASPSSSWVPAHGVRQRCRDVHGYAATAPGLRLHTYAIALSAWCGRWHEQALHPGRSSNEPLRGSAAGIRASGVRCCAGLPSQHRLPPHPFQPRRCGAHAC